MYTQIILLVGFSLVITLLMFNAKGVERFSDIAVIGLAVLVTLVLSTLGIYFIIESGLFLYNNNF